jgi:signal transduction histidine kinase
VICSCTTEQREYLQLIQSSSERLARTLGLALELASLGSRESELRRQHFVLDDVLHPLVTVYSPQAATRGLRLRVRGPVGTEFWAEASTYQLRLWVEDTGRGIDPRDHERVFEPFEQADSSCKREHEGAGSGLCIARQIVERMGGFLRLGETKHGGARFELGIRLPSAQHVPA